MIFVINTNDFPAGVYLLKIHSGDKLFSTGKLIKY
ncbi:MAG: T9SS type A sorting domain-containing protein [Bacteroidetes bacterium]|nr:T9SS type A sorting domain-containing protein [Bacteroidota bacterium]